MGRRIDAFLNALKYIQFGGTGVPYTTPPSRDVIYESPWEDTSTASGKSVTPATALTYAPFFAGVRLIAESVGRLPIIVYRRTGNDERERATENRYWGLLHDEPNPWMSAMAWKSAMQGHLVTRGNCYSERVKDDLGRDVELFPLRPDRTQVLFDTDRGVKFFRVRIESLGDEVDLPASRVFHIPGFGFDGLVGYSIVTLFRESIALGLSAQEFGARFFRSGGQPAAVVTVPASWDDKRKSRFAASLRGNHGGLSNAQRIAILDEGVSWETVGMNLDDAQFIETRKLQRSDAATILNVPPHMIGDVERSTSWGTGIEEQTLGFVTFNLGNWLDLWDQETNRQLIRPAYPDLYAEHLIEALLKGRAEDRGKFYQLLWSMGVVNADWIARRENLPAPADGSGSRYYVPVNFASVDAAAADSAPPEPPVPPNGGNGNGAIPLDALARVA